MTDILEKLISHKKYIEVDCNIKTIEDMYKINSSLKKNLIELALEIEHGYDFKNLF